MIVRLSSIGDIVLTTPVPRALKQQLQAEVHFLTKKSFHSLLVHNPYVDKIHHWEEGMEPLLAEDFDYVIDLHHNWRTHKLKRRLSKPAYSFNKLNIEKWLLTTFKLDRLPKKHIVERYMEAIAPLGVQMDEGGLDFFLSKEEEVDVSSLGVKEGQSFVALVIGGQHATKIMPLDKLQELVKLIDEPIVIVGGPEDAERGELLAQQAAVFNACGRFSINQSASIIQQASRVITHDTGMMHIAAAFQKEIVSIWGNTVPVFGMYPYRADAKSTILEVEGLSCRPCSKIGYKKCPKGHFKCMNDISLDLFRSK